MEFRIHQLSLIEPANQQPFFEEEVRKKMSRIEKILGGYPKELLLEILIKKEGHIYVIKGSLTMRSKVLIVEEKGTKAVILANNVLDNMRVLIRKQLTEERKEYLSQRKSRTHHKIEHANSLKKEQGQKEDKSSSSVFTKRIVPEMEKYVKKEIHRNPVLASLIKKGLIEPADIIDEVYLDLYAHFQKTRTAGEKFVLEAFTLSDKKVNELGVKYSKQFKQVVSTELLTKKEMSEMVEELTANAEFKPVLTEEVEQEFFAPDEYNLQEILTDAGAEEEILDKADSAIKSMHIQKLLRELPEEHQSIFELYYLYRFSAGEISQIKNMSESRIEELLRGVRTILLQSVKNFSQGE
jgi:hypothetical protein